MIDNHQNSMTAGRAAPMLQIIDSDLVRMRMASVIADDLGLAVDEHDTADSAENACATVQPDLILLEVTNDPALPARLVGSRDGFLPIVVAIAPDDTTLASVIDHATAQHQVVDVLLAPVTTHELEARVRLSIARVRQLEELRADRERRADQARMWEVLLAFSRRVADLDDDEELLEAIVHAASEMTCSKRVSIMVPDDTGHMLSVATAIGFDAREVRDLRVPVDSSVAGRVYTTGSRTTADDLRAHDDDDALENAYDCTTFASIPMASTVIDVEHERVGVLNITQRSEDRPFQPWELEFIDLLGSIAGSAMDDLRTRRQREEARESIVAALATLAESRDDETGRHVERVTRFSMLLAHDLRHYGPYGNVIDESFLTNLRRATPLHDIGKVAIPDAVLLKPGRLTDDEMAIMRSHADHGRNTIRSVIARTSNVSFLSMAEEIAGGHHEWWDGNGYPDGVSGATIPLAARIVALADVYDAITSERVYKRAMTHEEAIAIIQENRGVQFDPDIVDAFMRCEDEFRGLAQELHDTNHRPAGPHLEGRRDVA